MSLYTLALFAHILGVLGLFIGMGLQWTITLRLRRARSIIQVREWSSLTGSVAKLSPASGVLLLTAGIYMMAVAWGMTAWIVVSLAAMLFMMALGMGVTTRRLKAVHRAAALAEAHDKAIPSEVWLLIHSPLLWISAQLTGAVALGVVFLMTTKPSLGGSLLVLALALVFGGIAGAISVSLKPRRTPHTATIPMKEVSLG